jgi:phosphate transport system substrate-binding protein
MKFLLSLILLSSMSCMASPNPVSGSVKIDGSSTVYPLSEGVAEEFNKAFPQVKVSVGLSGTGGGFKKFTVGETDISDASRSITASESAKAKENNIEYLQIPVSYDGIAVVVNKNNTWVKSLTTAELKKIWNAGSTVKTWKDIRLEWPNRPIKLYGPSTDNGTFDYFTEEINGKAKSCRSDYSASREPNVLVQGVSGDLDSFGYFGFSYYLENKNKLNIVAIDNGKGPVIPSATTIGNNTYSPLSRKIYIYISKNAVKRMEVKKFVSFYIENAPRLSKEIGQVPLDRAEYQKISKRFEAFAGM